MTLWLATLLTPLALAAVLAMPGLPRRLGLRLAPLAALPAVALAVVASPGDRVDLGWILLGATLRLDEVSLAFLALGAAVWLGIGIYGAAFHRGERLAHRITGFFCLAMAGSFTLTLAGDVVTFYTGFAMMTFSAYALVVHDGTAEARWAGKVYIAMAVVGEACLFAGFLLAAVSAGTIELAAMPVGIAEGRWPALTILLLLVGFGIKAGLLGLHVWLPLAHPVAPTPSSAVLSGVMIKAGLLGMLVFLPIGAAEVGWAAIALVALGLGAAFISAGIGVLQDSAKVNLAYSSVGQMGIMIAVLGVAPAAPELRGPAAVAVAVYALQHGLTKAGLFCAVGVAGHTTGAARGAVVVVVALLGATLAAAPFTAGAVAKQGLKDVAELGPVAPEALVMLLTLSGAATALLIGRFAYLIARMPATAGGPAVGLWLPTALLAGGALIAAWIVPGLLAIGAPSPVAPAPWTSLWPVLLGLAILAAGAESGSRWVPKLADAIRPGDILVVQVWIATRAYSAAVASARSMRDRAAVPAARAAWVVGLAPDPTRVESLERGFERWEVAGLAFVVVAVVVGVALW